MADLYGHYKGVEPGNITSATASLRTKVEQIRTKLGSLKTSLSDDIWKATAKSTLITAFDQIDSEVCEDILTKLDNADEIAGLVEKYNTAKSEAESYSSKLNSSTNQTPQTDKDSWSAGLQSQEKIMSECISSISGLF